MKVAQQQESNGCVSLERLRRLRRLRQQNTAQKRDLDREAAAWRLRAQDLGDWTQQCLVNRSDVHGHYLPLDARTDPKKKAVTRYEEVTPELLPRHFIGADHGHLIGLHTTSPDNRSRWMAIDIDSHDGDSREVTWPATLALSQRFQNLGLHVLVLDSDGNGGFHLLVLFDSSIPTERLYDFGRCLLRDTSLPDLLSVPELFPKQRNLKPGQIGNWLRLLGRHHTRDHWTRVWDGARWLTGDEAIQRILNTKLNSESQIPNLEEAQEKVTSSSQLSLKQFDSKYPVAHPLNQVLSRLQRVTRSGEQWAARCPAHDDHSPSLSVSVGERGQVLAYCHRDCGLEAILEAIDLSHEDLYPDETLVGRQRPAAKTDVCNRDREPTATATTHWPDLAHQFEETLTEEGLLALANALKVSPHALQDICVGWNPQSKCYTIPERDAAFNVIGIMQRFADGEKRCMTGSKRGLCIPIGFRERGGPILIVEGASDVAALLTQELCAVGRPSAMGGGKFLAELLKDDPRDIVVVGEFDPKPDGTWPGKEGAERIARQLATDLQREIPTTMPPDKHKDVREWLAQLNVT